MIMSLKRTSNTSFRLQPGMHVHLVGVGGAGISAIAWVLFLMILVFSLLVFRSQERWVYYEGGQRR